MSSRIRRLDLRTRHTGNAIAETLIALLALAPLIAGIPLLGKQIDIKQKTFDAARYSVWERVVWRSIGTTNSKSEEDIRLETRDRVLGDPRAGMSNLESLRSAGITENPLWRDSKQQRLVDYHRDQAGLAIDFNERQAPVDVGYFLVPGVAHGDGPIATIGGLLRVEDLKLARRTFATTELQLGVRSILHNAAQVPRTLGSRDEADDDSELLSHRARAAILSDAWSASDENDFRRRIDWVTTDELIETLELPARPIGSMALGKGELLYGEGQFGWDPSLDVNSTTLPRAYVTRE
jgi:hypothetical protein